MGFSIGYDVGVLGWLVVALGIGAVAIVLIFFLSAANQARREVIDEERDEGNDPPVA